MCFKHVDEMIADVVKVEGIKSNPRQVRNSRNPKMIDIGYDFNTFMCLYSYGPCRTHEGEFTLYCN